MTTTNLGDHSEPAVACALTTADLAAQAQRWTRLVGDAGIARERTNDGIRLVFRAEPDVERELRALVAVENACCSWARWQVLHQGHKLVMRASATDHGIATLHGLVDQPQRRD